MIFRVYSVLFVYVVFFVLCVVGNVSMFLKRFFGVLYFFCVIKRLFFGLFNPFSFLTKGFCYAVFSFFSF